MKLAYSIVALDDYGVRLKEVLKPTVDKTKARLKLEELNDALAKRVRRIDGVKVERYKIISEPM